MEKSIIIIGAGMGGLASGIYGQLNGYSTRVFELHAVPGGQCASWKRKGYTFDGCIHHLFGCAPGSRLYGLWSEVGAMPRETVKTRECVSVASPEGKLFIDYYDLEMLREHLKELSPEDSALIDEYVDVTPRFARHDIMAEAMVGTKLGVAKMIPGVLPLLKWFKPTDGQFAERFRDPFLRKAFALVDYSVPITPFFLHISKKAYGLVGDLQWPVGASLEFARSMEKRYLDLGGEVHYRARVTGILTEGDRAVGVRLEDGTEERADLVISNADARNIILRMLGGRYINDKIRASCAQPDDVTPWSVHVFLGVNRDLSDEPSSLVQLLPEPVTLANHETDSIEMQIYGFDRTMAPEGKGTIKVELVSSYSYWKKLYEDRGRYDEEKEKVADEVINLLDATHFPGIKQQVEVVDVPTMMTWERYMGGSYGFMTGPAKQFNPMTMLFGKGYATLPGLANFYQVGMWATETGALFVNALSGRKTIAHLCNLDGKQFRSA